MERIVRIVAGGFSGLGVALLLLGMLSAPSSAFANDDECTTCTDACLASGKTQQECAAECFNQCQAQPPPKQCGGDLVCNDQSCFYRLPTSKCSEVGDAYPIPFGGTISVMCKSTRDARCTDCGCQKDQNGPFSFYCSCKL